MQVNQPLRIKYRPKKLDSVIGQPSAVSTLKGKLKSKKIDPTYFFSGPTGTGKTSVARILAHYVNCVNFNYDTLEPCKTCDYCEAVAKGHYPDVEELNFSNETGIDTVRQLIDDLQYEGSSNVKVYILDEMHNMSAKGQDALLKNLEEPPPNVIFFLVTSEPKKVKPALRGRCQSVDFGRVSSQMTYKYLYTVAKREKYEVPEYTLKHIAMISNGDLRTALNDLEKVFNVLDTQEGVDVANQEFLFSLVGSAAQSDIFTIADYLIQGLYTGRCKLATAEILKLVRKDPINYRQFFERAYEFHTATTTFLADPGRSVKEMHLDFYQDWYVTLVKSIGDGTFLLTMSAATEVLSLIVELCDKLKFADPGESKVVHAYSMRMLDAIRTKAGTASAQKELEQLKTFLAPKKEVA